MGLLDTLLGRTKPVRANLDALFALPSAAISLQTAAGLVSTGHAGVSWKPPAGQTAEDLESEIGQLLAVDDGPGGAAAGADAAPPIGTFTHSQDAFGFHWLLLHDPDIADLVTRVHMANTTLTEAGWGPQLLCSMFGFGPSADAAADTKSFFLVYLYKRGTFYPFAPSGKEQRDNELELRIQALLGKDLPVEPDLSRWFPLWDSPVR
ncbi:MAG TPA: hypothetical protein VN781_07780 [Acidimicrobiales bacterium]|nr:hypothetical protein [Acidimicrobiales bacterium]